MGRLTEDIPLSPFFFDALHVDGADLIDLSTRERLAALDGLIPPELRVPRIETDELVAAQAFLEATLERGHEGVLVKSPDAVYEAGRRGAGWPKVKVAHTLDLVVLAAEWGHGRRQGKLSNLHLGARDPASGGFVMLGKTFKGLTDVMLEWQTERLLELEERREGHVVHVRPELVVEVRSTAFSRARATPAVSRFASRASRATGPTSGPTRPTRSTPCARSTIVAPPRRRGRRDVDSSGRPPTREVAMTHYGTLRAWAFIATLVGIFGMIVAAIGAIIWAFEVEGFWQTLGVLLVGLPISVFIATIPIALGQAMRAIADVGDTVSAR